jgi:hypothetical protein
VTIKLFKLKEHEKRRVITSLNLDGPGDRETELTIGIKGHRSSQVRDLAPARKPALTDNSTITVLRTGWWVEEA